MVDGFAYIFNLSFTTGIVPDLIKTAKVVPMQKGKEMYQETIDLFRYININVKKLPFRH